MNLAQLVTSLIAAFLASIASVASLTQTVADRDATIAANQADTDAKLKELDVKYQADITAVTAKLDGALADDVTDKEKIAAISQELNDIKTKFAADEQTIVDLNQKATDAQAAADAALADAAKQTEALTALQATDAATATAVAEALTKAGIPTTEAPATPVNDVPAA